ncbi:MAG: hypothetical protein Q9190_007405 [Brigantiaea leucoxantha]
MSSLQIGSHWHEGNPPFMQQGQVDWVAFGNTIWTASSAVLQRFATAGIQPVTYGAGLALSSQIRLDRKGQLRMEKAVASLRSISAFGKFLWFGFGYQDFAHALAETVPGLKCLALCACLAEAHPEDLAAWILSELWHISGFPEDYEPSHSQFLALVKASAGILSSTDFGRMLDTMLGNQLWEKPLGRDYSAQQVDELEEGVLEASNAKDIADTLHGLFKISRGEVDHVIVNGGSECAFIAAIAHWLLNLRVRVLNSSGHLVFENSMHGGDAQVSIRYGQASKDAVEIVGTTYLLGNCRDIIGRIPAKENFHLVVRTPWESCLSRVFGSRFTKLSELPHLLGDYLGGVARVYTALATGEKNVASLSRIAFIDFSESSYGYGFVDTVFSTFPELKVIDGLRERVSHTAESSFDNAIGFVEASVIALESLCSCEYCSKEHHESEIYNETSRACVVGVAYAIRRIAMVMSRVVQDPESPGLLPALSGLYDFSGCGKQGQLPNGPLSEPLTQGRESLNKKSKWSRASFYWNALGLHHDQPIDTSFDYHLLVSPALLFQGSIPTGEGMRFTDPNTCTALSAKAICCFMEALTALGCRAEMVCKVRIISGHIEYKTRYYDSVYDGQLNYGPTEPHKSENVHDSEKGSVTLQQPSDGIPATHSALTVNHVQALASDRKSGSSIVFVFRVSLPNGPIYISPGRLTQLILRNSGLIICPTNGCKSHLSFPCTFVERGWNVRKSNPGLSYSSGIACCIWMCKDEITRCVAVASNSKSHILANNITNRQFIYLRRHEFLSCSTQAVLRNGGKFMAKDSSKESKLPDIIVNIS